MNECGTLPQSSANQHQVQGMIDQSEAWMIWLYAAWPRDQAKDYPWAQDN